MKSDYSQTIFKRLEKLYPGSGTILNYSNDWELLVAVILSAQCTDKRVNIVTKDLFSKYKTLDDYVKADLAEFEQDIRSTGFYHNKAKNVLAAAKMVKNDFGGKLPKTIEQMILIPGVARKTANVVLGNAFGIVQGIAVDTHVGRVSQRLGLTKNSDPIKIERDLMEIYPKDQWLKLTYLLINHGRAICEAKKPKCDQCVLSDICPSAFKFPHFTKNKNTLS